MKRFKVAKLVRDKIVDNMKASNQLPKGIKKLDDDEYLKELVIKVVEEAQEMQNFENLQELKEELADVQEVLDYIIKELNLSSKEIKDIQKKKIEKNGGFEKRIYLEEVDMEESNDWFDYYDSHPKKYPKIN
jgi:predicted house-cleaning noncanonical NTP pyrophosphatase (MazG superfamily)